MHEISREFRFDAAHTLQREVEAEGSRRVHGHSYRARVTLRGRVDPATGMVADLGHVAARLDAVRGALDHRLLDAVEGLGPATMENLCSFIWRRLEGELEGLHEVMVLRDSTAERAAYRGER